MPKTRLVKKEEKKSLNIKIPEDLYNRLQRARNTARDQDAIYNVSQAVEEFLRRDVVRVEKELNMPEQSSNDDQPDRVAQQEDERAAQEKEEKKAEGYMGESDHKGGGE